MLLQLGDDVERGVAKDQRRLIAGLKVPLDDVGHSRAIERYVAPDPRQDGPEGVGGLSQQLDRVAGDVFGKDPALPVHDRTPGRGQRNGAQPVGLRLELELLVLQNLGPEEGSAQDQECPDQYQPGNVGTLPDPVRIEVHASSRTEKIARKVTSTTRANAAVVSA